MGKCDATCDQLKRHQERREPLCFISELGKAPLFVYLCNQSQESEQVREKSQVQKSMWRSCFQTPVWVAMTEERISSAPTHSFTALYERARLLISSKIRSNPIVTSHKRRRARSMSSAIAQGRAAMTSERWFRKRHC